MDSEQRIAKINELSLHLRSIWIGLLIALVFVGITLMGHRDADFFAFGAATTLPVVNVNVHPTAFFLAAPILIAAMYIYLHIFLLSLWDRIGDAEATYGSEKTPLSDHVTPTIFVLAAVWYRNRNRGDGSMAPSVLGAWMVAIALGLGWAFGLFVLLLIWVRGMPLHDFWVTFVSAFSFWAATLVAGLSLRSAEGRMRGRSRQSLAIIGPTIFLLAITALLTIILTSWERTKGGILAGLGVSEAFQIPLARADLKEAYLTRRPADWQPFELWFATLDPKLTTDASRKSEIAELWKNRVNSLEAADLSGRDLRGADLSNAFMPGANLRGADLTDARMQGANLAGANFRGSTFEGVDLKHAVLQGAVLSGLKIYRSDMSFSRLQFSDFFSSRILDTDLSHSDLSDADMGRSLLLGSQLVKTNLSNVEFGEADVLQTDFSGATFGQTDLTYFFASNAQFLDVDFTGANLSNGYFLNTDFTYANFNAVTLKQTCFVMSNLAGTNFSTGPVDEENGFFDPVEFFRSSLIDADLLGLKGMLTQTMLASAYGGSTTQLPPDLVNPPHWSTEDVGGIGGGGSYTPDLPWFQQTRQQMEASRALDDSSNKSIFVFDGWAEWIDGIQPFQRESEFCSVLQFESAESGIDVLDAEQIDYQGLEDEVQLIMAPEDDWEPAPELQ